MLQESPRRPALIRLPQSQVQRRPHQLINDIRNEIGGNPKTSHASLHMATHKAVERIRSGGLSLTNWVAPAMRCDTCIARKNAAHVPHLSHQQMTQESHRHPALIRLPQSQVQRRPHRLINDIRKDIRGNPKTSHVSLHMVMHKAVKRERSGSLSLLNWAAPALHWVRSIARKNAVQV